MSALPADGTRRTSIAIDPGVVPQSHFTRLFSGLAGMTRASFRKTFRRLGGSAEELASRDDGGDAA